MPKFILTECAEVDEEEMKKMQQELDEVRSIVGAEASIVVMMQSMLDNADKVA